MKDMAHIGRSQDESSLPELKDFVERKIRERIGIQITVLDTAARKKGNTPGKRTEIRNEI